MAVLVIADRDGATVRDTAEPARVLTAVRHALVVVWASRIRTSDASTRAMFAVARRALDEPGTP